MIELFTAIVPYFDLNIASVLTIDLVSELI